MLDKTDFLLTDWSPDGEILLGWSQRTATSFDITYVRLDEEDHQVHDLLNTRFIEFLARFSPDGAWVAYQSNESGQMEVYVTDFPDATRKWQVSRDGGTSPDWRSDGREIYFKESGRITSYNVCYTKLLRIRDGGRSS